MSSYPPFSIYQLCTHSLVLPFPLYVVNNNFGWSFVCICKPTEVPMSAGGYRQTECRLWHVQCRLPTWRMSAPPADHRLPVGRIFWKFHLCQYKSTRFFYSTALEDWSPRCIHLVILIIKIDIHTRNSLSLLLSLLYQRVMFTTWFHSKYPQNYYIGGSGGIRIIR